MIEPSVGVRGVIGRGRRSGCARALGLSALSGIPYGA